MLPSSITELSRVREGNNSIFTVMPVSDMVLNSTRKGLFGL